MTASERRRLRHAGRSAFRGHGRGRRRGPLLMIGAVLATLFVLGVGLAGTASLYGLQRYDEYAKGVVPPEQLLAQLPRGGARVYDRNGVLLYEFVDEFGGLRRPIAIGDISPWMQLATISTEDTTFYENNGLNTRGLVRAALTNFTPLSGALFEGSGGSSITQQLAKNVYIPPRERLQRTVERKLKETVIALELTERYPKAQVLEWYLNSIPYGGVYVGIEAAAQGYFGKEAKYLTLSEAALLAGVPQSPAIYEPIANPDAAKARQDEVLNLMVRHGVITAAQAAEASAEPIRLSASRFDIVAPHFVLGPVAREVTTRFGQIALYQGGIEVTTTLDTKLQVIGEQAVEQWVKEHEATSGGHNGALIAIDPRTGQVLTYVGSRDYFRDDIQGRNDNIAALNSPGSTLKPFTYMTAFAQGWSTGTAIVDSPAKIIDPSTNQPFSPRNPGNASFYGPVTVATALGNSLNIPAFKTMIQTGVTPVVNTLKAAGVTTLNDPRGYGPALTLGGADIRLDDLTYAYSALAAEGQLYGQQPLTPHAPGDRSVDPVVLLRVTDSQGRALYEFKQPVERRVLPASLAYMATSVMSDPSNTCLIFTCGQLDLPDRRPTAHKTGTSEPYENSRDIGDTWAFGYTPDLVAGIWVGNADNSPMKNIFSTTISWPIWRDFMVGALKQLELPPKPFTRPATVEERDLCWPSGRYPTELCPKARAYKGLVATDAIPTDKDKLAKLKDTWWQKVPVDMRTGLLAGPGTPGIFVSEQVRLVFPKEELESWEGVREWAEAAGVAGQLAPSAEASAAGAGLVSIVSPTAGQRVNGLLAVSGRAASPDFTSYFVEWGAGVNPSTWSAITGSLTGTPGRTLATWDTRAVADGDYVLRVRLNDRNLGELQYAVAVVVSNSGGSGRTPLAAIVAPSTGAVIRNSISVAGTATSTGTLLDYALEVGEGTNPSRWTLLRRGTTPIVSGVLGDFNPTLLSLQNGTYTIRLTVRDVSGATTGSTITITVTLLR
ncbi:MAG: hypothetical protein EXR68_05820 [Dehalococcoidia bacterium]|nr:hypothetical protein [Dehalococcoidia bacterium]